MAELAIVIADLALASKGASHGECHAASCQVGPSWKRPEVPNDDEAQKGPKRPCVRPAPGRAVSGTIEEELAGKDCDSICGTSCHISWQFVMASERMFMKCDQVISVCGILGYCIWILRLDYQQASSIAGDSQVHATHAVHAKLLGHKFWAVLLGRSRHIVSTCLHTGVKPSADASMPQAGEDTVQPASEQEAGVPHVAAGDEVGSLAVDIKSTQGGTDMTNPQDAADQGIPEAGDAANGVALSDHQTATPEPASAGADPVSTATAAVEAASELPTQAASNSGAMEQELAVPVVPVEAADGHQSSAGSEAVAVGKGPKAKALLHVDAANKHASLIDVPIQSDVAVPMDEDVT